MGKIAERIDLTVEQRRTLEERAASSSEQRQWVRARIILLAAEGRSNEEIATELGVVRQTAAKWRERFRSKGVAGLGDGSRRGRPPRYGHDDRLTIVRAAIDKPPAPASHWTMSKVANALRDDVGVSASQVWRILSRLDLKPWQSRSWLTSHDPDVWETAADVCGLYLNPPDNALAVSVDERTVVKRSRLDSQDEGIAVLFAAFDVRQEGDIQQAGEWSRSRDFISYLEHLDRVTSQDLTVHLVLDIGSSTVSNQTHAWLELNGDRFEAHRAQGHDFWLNQVNLVFTILGRRLVHHSAFGSLDDLIHRVSVFINDANENARPFRWTHERTPRGAA